MVPTFWRGGGEKLLAFNVSVVKHYIPPMDVSSLGFSISTTHPLSPHSHPSLSQSHEQRLWQNLATVLSQLTEPLWTAPGKKSGHIVGKLTSTLKKKKALAGNERLNILKKKKKNPLRWGKSHLHHGNTETKNQALTL